MTLTMVLDIPAATAHDVYMETTYRTVTTQEVSKGDIIANVGVVAEQPTQAGVFVIIPIRGTIWSLGVGLGDIATWDLVLHQAEDVVLTILPRD